MTRQLDVRSSASIEVEGIRTRRAAQVNGALQLAQVIEPGDHRSCTLQGVSMEPTVEMGPASAAIVRRDECDQIAVGEAPHAAAPRAQMDEAIPTARGAEGL